MKRSELESQLRAIPQKAKLLLEAAPVPYFFVGVVLGVFLTVFSKFFFTVLIIALLLLTGLWFFGEKEGSESQSENARTPSSGSNELH